MEEDFGDNDDHCEGEIVNPSLYLPQSEIPNITLKYLNYTTKYVRSWGIDEAFREIYQNWRDGILVSFNLTLAQFHTVTEEKGSVILIKAFGLDETRLLGFIRFKYGKNGECEGGLTIANFAATLHYHSLGTGATSKASNRGQTGQHGEGMKLAALVFRRNNYNFRIESGSFTWNFIFSKGELACRLRRMTDKKLMKAMHDDSGLLRIPRARPWSDVCVIIGLPGLARTSKDVRVKGRRIHVDDFRRMLKVTIDVDPPEMIRTSKGDLIRDPKNRGQMYLRGLLLPRGGNLGKDYTYGYNFVDGDTTRDREAILGCNAESERIAAIWASAIRADDSPEAKLATEYTDLLLTSLNRKGDVVLDLESRNFLASDIARTVWKKMREKTYGQQERPAFYYSAVEHKNEVQIIEQSLHKNPIPLDAEMFKMLQQFNLCRTPAEELRHRFESASIITIPDHSFANNMNWMLKCLLQSSPITKDMQVVFVDGRSLQMDAAFSGTTWRIHDRWLTHEGAHRGVFCEETTSDHQHLFICDHAVLHLWEIMLSQLKQHEGYDKVGEKEPWLKSIAMVRLSQMPRASECQITDHKHELRVLWQSVDSHQNKDKIVKIVLHAEGCTESSEFHHQQREVLQYLSDQERMCSCPSQGSSAVNTEGVVFTNLRPTEAYFPSVSRDTKEAFVALPPMSVSPLRENRKLSPDLEMRSRAPSPTWRVTSPINLDIDPIIISDDEWELTDNKLDETENESLYKISARDASSSGLPFNTRSRPDQVTTRGAGSIVKTFHDGGVQTDLAELPDQELYVLGPQIQHSSLDWGGTFPGSHAFYRARDDFDKDIFILKPKQHMENAHIKRKAEEQMTSATPKAGRFQAGLPDDSEHNYIPNNTVPLSSPATSRANRSVHTAMASRGARSTTRETTTTMTPMPEGGITYRY